MTPLWSLRDVSPRYQYVTTIWAADIWKKVKADDTHFDWGVILSNDLDDHFWFDDVEVFFNVSQDRWLGHFPDGFDDQLRAIVALLD